MKRTIVVAASVDKVTNQEKRILKKAKDLFDELDTCDASIVRNFGLDSLVDELNDTIMQLTEELAADDVR